MWLMYILIEYHYHMSIFCVACVGMFLICFGNDCTFFAHIGCSLRSFTASRRTKTPDLSLTAVEMLIELHSTLLPTVLYLWLWNNIRKYECNWSIGDVPNHLGINL